MSKATRDWSLVGISGFVILSTFVICHSSLSSGMNESSKHQTPNPKEAPNLKLQFGGIAVAFGIWSLEFLWSLVFGIWDLPSPVFFPPAVPRKSIQWRRCDMNDESRMTNDESNPKSEFRGANEIPDPKSEGRK
jgi:hypothetical protein